MTCDPCALTLNIHDVTRFDTDSTYRDGNDPGEEDWHPETDGEGFSLTVVDANADAANWSIGTGWRSSALIGGSPGAADPEPLVGDVDGDGDVDRYDAARLVRNLGRNGNSHRGRGDLDGDRATTLVDLAMLQANLGAPFPSPQAVAMPATTPPTQDDANTATDVVFADSRRLMRRVTAARRLSRPVPTNSDGNSESRLAGVRDADVTQRHAERNRLISLLRARRSRIRQATQLSSNEPV